MSNAQLEGQSSAVKRFFEQPALYFRNRHIVELRRELAQELLGGLENAAILDLGCGDGSISLPLLGTTNRAVLVDFSESMLELAKVSIPVGAEERVELLNMEVNDFISELRFDVVICSGVLAHVPDAEKTFQRAAGHVKPGGHCLIQITDHEASISRFVRLFSRLRKFSNPSGGSEPKKITGTEIAEWARGSSLWCVEARSYSIGVPGINRLLPTSLLRRYADLTLKRKELAFLCSERVFLFRKDIPSSQ